MVRRREYFENSVEPRRFVWYPNGRYEVLSETCKSPLRWIGGKNYLAKWIISHFPPHRCYVEPFGGGMNVLLQKSPSRVEVYNDIDAHVVEFFQVLKEHPMQLISTLEFMPYSRLIYESWVKLAKKGKYPKDRIERVALWCYLQGSAFAGKKFGGWGHGKTQNHGKRFLSLGSRLIETSNRLRSIQLENSDFRKIIETYDAPETLFYCDPPYLEAEKYYEGGFNIQDHEALARLLHEIKGKVCLSYCPHPFVNEHYGNWRRDEKIVPIHSFGITLTSHIDKKPKRTELLLMNF